jgi:16S rRNA (adenine1518-N6/adenine1519-N6)-dimethyltransferase
LVEVPAIDRLLFMVQREVGERMAAQVGDPAYGSVSVRVAYFARSSVAGKVPASVFIPRPRVESVLVRMERRPEPAVPLDEVTYERLAAVVKAGFGQRRKMLRSSLAGVVTPEAFVRAGIRPEARAEELTVEEWGDWHNDADHGSGQAHAVAGRDRRSGRRLSRTSIRDGQLSA